MAQHYSSVYALCNTATGEAYIGCTGDIPLRWRQHRAQLQKGKHSNHSLQRAWDNSGSATFSLVILARCLPNPISSALYTLLHQERRWLARARAAGVVLYNDQVGGGRKKAA